MTTRLAINELRSARARRERYVGEWLPEPIITDGSDDPARQAEMADSLSLAMLVLLERLSPGAARGAAAARRVRLRLRADRRDHRQEPGQRPSARDASLTPRRAAPAPVPDHARAARGAGARFFAAAEQGDLAGLEALLASDVELTGDGGGKVPALARTLRGRGRVARTLINWIRRAAGRPGMSLRPVEVNGGPGALYLDARQRLIAVVALEIAGGQITSISSIVNPDKLAHLGPTADLGSLLRTRAPGN